MDSSQLVTEVKVEEYVFPPTVKAPGSHNSFFLGGAGVRGIQKEDVFVKVTAIGVYLEESAIPVLAAKWKGKTADDLVVSDEFFEDVITGPFEKFIQVSLILPLTGQQFSEKASDNCTNIWKAHGIYTDKEAKAIEKFIETFKDEKFPPGHSILFTQSPLGSLTIAFSKHDFIPKVGKAVIENRNMAEAMTKTIIGKHGVSPEAKRSLANRVAEVLNKNDDKIAFAKHNPDAETEKNMIASKNWVETKIESGNKGGDFLEAKHSLVA